ncbi:MAG: hypothetical protein PWP28_1130 [Oceanotoga sp.]|uniref:sigma-54-dependent transcriptional regulator n=1 Tax=Oceanotoga sp. TaxID=2108366 RepID=UPI002651D654|nr:sigma 54-interacting transcriptional regulator [Oceanotoga sp.]MDN5342255.1 hypothetical protein [Oceanotoga sp.]
MIYTNNYDLISEIIESLDKQFKYKKEKFEKDLFSDELNENIKYCIVDETFFKKYKFNNDFEDKTGLKIKKIYKNNISKYKFILLVEENLKDSIFDIMTEYEVLGVFRKKRLEFELEEKGKLEKLLKEIIRDLNSKLSNEGRDSYFNKKYTFKDLDWKFKMDFKSINKTKEFYSKKKYVSMFLDPSMRNFYNQLNSIIKDFKNSFNEISFLNLKKDTESINSINEISEILNKKFREDFKLPSLLIEGETGTGKSLLASIISDKVKESSLYKFSLVNISENLIDSEIFGNAKGAFTGADEDRKGRLLNNIGNFVFFDEIAEIPTKTQTKLLLYLDDYKINPEGYDGKSIPVPTFVIGATNRNLRDMMINNDFRTDLYHRFKYKIRIPSLKERKEDMRFLISFIMQNPYINDLGDNGFYKVNKISMEAIKKLENYEYPGNFRELEYIIKFAVNRAIYNEIDIILPEHIIF